MQLASFFTAPLWSFSSSSSSHFSAGLITAPDAPPLPPPPPLPPLPPFSTHPLALASPPSNQGEEGHNSQVATHETRRFFPQKIEIDRRGFLLAAGSLSGGEDGDGFLFYLFYFLLAKTKCPCVTVYSACWEPKKAVQENSVVYAQGREGERERGKEREEEEEEEGGATAMAAN